MRFSWVLAACLFIPKAANATYGVVEVAGGASESGYEGQVLHVKTAVAAGVTWKLPKTALRLHLLAQLARTSGSTESSFAGLPARLDREDVDLLLSPRLVLPVFGLGRAYVEAGVGERFFEGTVEREGLAPLLAEDRRPLAIFAVGAGVRPFELFTVGARAEWVTELSGPDPFSLWTELRPSSRFAVLASASVHF